MLSQGVTLAERPRTQRDIDKLIDDLAVTEEDSFRGLTYVKTPEGLPFSVNTQDTGVMEDLNEAIEQGARDTARGSSFALSTWQTRGGVVNVYNPYLTFDMKPGFLNSTNAKTSPEGIRYARIPVDGQIRTVSENSPAGSWIWSLKFGRFEERRRRASDTSNTLLNELD